MIANGLFAAVTQSVVRQIEPSVGENLQILFDARLVLRRRRDDAGVGDLSIGIEAVAMIQHAARRLGRRIAGSRARLDFDRRPLRLFVVVDDAQRLVAGVKNFDGANDDAAEGIGADRSKSCVARRLARDRRERRGVQRVARQGPGEIGAARLDVRMQRGRMFDVALLEMFVIFSGGDVEPAA